MRRTQRGFTIIELLIATAVFSLMILVITAAILQFTRQYYRGIIASSTQSAARRIVDDISRSVQFNRQGIYELRQGTLVRGYCIGESKRYSFEPYRQVQDNVHGLVSDSVNATCNTSTAPLDVSSISSLTTPNARELLGDHMRLAKMSIDGSGGIYVIKLKVVYGDDDLLTNASDPDMQCKGGAGSQFCAVSELTTTVKRRVE